MDEKLAAYAVPDEPDGDRAFREPGDSLRLPFERDRHRIIECMAFRRLEGKTQVFNAGHHDHFRTRLTHSLEVAQIARVLANKLRANESLVEAIALAHDLGHPPFGHAGEAALNDAMSQHGGFNHNLQSMRVVEFLEHPFPPFRGLNLTAELRAGLARHATRYDTPSVERVGSRCSVESQIVSLADRIAYNCHDLEDAIGAGFVNAKLLSDVRIWRNAYDKAVTDETSNLFAVRRVVLNAMLDELLTDVIETSRPLLGELASPQEVCARDGDSVRFSAGVEQRFCKLEQFLAEQVYRHPEIAAADARGRQIIDGLFEAYTARSELLPDRFAKRIEEQGICRVVCDYIAGMTDRFCETEHERVCDRESPN
ncbi:MAG: dNTP triphosphohydrolase [Planctomycetes bacterium]|nr:dNTP triphosphohydrolase [Planctomycetota bacterium]